MKALAFSLLLLSAFGCAKSNDPAPATLTSAPAVTYTDAGGRQVPLSGTLAYSVTAPPNVQRQERRAVVVRALLPNGSTLDLTYTYVGTFFKVGAGSMTLDEAVRVDNSGGPVSPSTRYQAQGVTTGTLSADAGSTAAVSGTYSGPLVAGGPVVQVSFSRLGFQ